MSWIKQLENLEPVSSSEKLHEKIYKMLRKAPGFTPETAKDFKGEQELLNKIFLAYLDFQKHPPYSQEGFGDMFGEYLIQTEQLYGRAGQFLTPMNVVKMMCQMILNPKLEEEPQYISDPAAGCGRFMIKTAEVYHKEIGAYNFLFHNVDIDHRMYVYCTMNAILYAIPSVNIWGDSLSLEYREAVQRFKPKWDQPKTGLEKFIDVPKNDRTPQRRITFRKPKPEQQTFIP